MKPQSPVKRLAKALVVLITFGSFLGITSTPATAVEQDWTIEVQVTNSNPACVSTITAATWQPETAVSYTIGSGNSRDVSDAFRTPVLFDVALDFDDGTDSCDPTAAISPTGTVTATLSDIAPELQESTNELYALDCKTPCAANNLPDARGIIRGALEVLNTAVGGQTYQATLTVVWTP